MKYTKYLAIVLASALSAAGCTGDFEDINSDPNNIIVVTLEDLPEDERQKLEQELEEEWVEK